MDKKKGWVHDDLVTELSAVESLKGKPKVIFVQACRGSKSFEECVTVCIGNCPSIDFI